mmetsp:Transcript_31154/g.63191  ORF Transcript_31154/g.63191 Transcript_31154/m.63191 type:complete len:154 (-) Transcript_31154:322-783(-)|eukprot:CAMPEP_0171637364 /NCGR_PEP_ID=MMETSP0990-20121206/28139_1 /TAXON_ID=483369 /ORGANISM="non described non described, Strain CCMP2098" /LENGTH=153 /DNA_ID=CAMNT_0012210027 /DNA_START=9 /DNA_END=470 /DNA_ORIENTATION=-
MASDSPPADTLLSGASTASAQSPTTSNSEWKRGTIIRDSNEAVDIVRFIEAVDDYTPTVPEAIIEQYLQLGGAQTDDDRVLKLVALATDKFIADIVHDAMENQKGVRLDSQVEPDTASGEEPREKRPLSMEDVTESLRKRGVKITKPSTAAEN